MSTSQLRQAAGLQTSDGKALSPLQTVQHYFTQHKDQIAAALPKHLTADRMCRLAMTAMSQNKALMECDPKSLFGAVVTASQLGLEIGVLGQCYLVPYKKTATLVPGWQGICDLINRAGRASVWTGAVFEGDQFDYQMGDSPFIRHKPCGEDEASKITHVYAVGRVNNSQWPVIDVWPIAKVWKHRDRYNKVGGRHYSYEYPEMYARKVVLLQVMKHMPKSIEITAAIDLSNRVDEGRGATLDSDFMVIDQGDLDAIQGEVKEVMEPPKVDPPSPPPPDAVQAAMAEQVSDEPTVERFLDSAAKADSLDALVTIRKDFKAIFPDATKDDLKAFDKAAAGRMAVLNEQMKGDA